MKQGHRSSGAHVPENPSAPLSHTLKITGLTGSAELVTDYLNPVPPGVVSWPTQAGVSGHGPTLQVTHMCKSDRVAVPATHWHRADRC